MEQIFNFFVLGTIPHPICRRHMIEMVHNARKGKLWALQMLDATSKITEGLLMANGFDYGNYEECLDVTASGYFGNFTGKHCLVDFKLPVPDTLVNKAAESMIKYRWSICVPSTCSGIDLTYLFKYGLHLPAEVTDRACISKDTNRPYTPREIFTLSLIALFMVLIFLSTLYDHTKTSAKKNELFQAFSLTRNLRTMLDLSTPPGSIDSLYGIRFFCTTFVILVHGYNVICFAANVNLIIYSNWLSDWQHMFLSSRGVLLDTFFVLGGFFASYMFLKDRASGKKFNFATFILHRFLRIAPALYMVLLFTATLSNRLSVAPFWRTWSKMNEDHCHDSWLQHVTFLQSWFGNLKCMEHAWYLSVDMQLFIISPILLYPLHRWPRVGIRITIFTMVLAFCGSFTSSYMYRENVDLSRHLYNKERDLYELPYNRLGPWAMGILVGYYVYKYRHYKSKTTEDGYHGSKSSPGERCKKYLISLLLLSITIALGVGVMAAAHPFLQSEYKYNVLESSFYLASSHMMAALSVLTLLIAIFSGYGGPVTIIFSSKLFVPLGRLSYSIFLIHLTVVHVWYIGINGPNFLSDFNALSDWFCITMYCILFSPALFLMVEQPFTVIDRILMKKLNGPSKFLNLLPEDGKQCETSTVPASDLQAACHINNVFELSEQLHGEPKQNEDTIFDLSDTLKARIHENNNLNQPKDE